MSFVAAPSLVKARDMPHGAFQQAAYDAAATNGKEWSPAGKETEEPRNPVCGRVRGKDKSLHTEVFHGGGPLGLTTNECPFNGRLRALNGCVNSRVRPQLGGRSAPLVGALISSVLARGSMRFLSFSARASSSLIRETNVCLYVSPFLSSSTLTISRQKRHSCGADSEQRDRQVFCRARSFLET